MSNTDAPDILDRSRRFKRWIIAMAAAVVAAAIAGGAAYTLVEETDAAGVTSRHDLNFVGLAALVAGAVVYVAILFALKRMDAVRDRATARVVRD